MNVFKTGDTAKLDASKKLVYLKIEGAVRAQGVVWENI